jgi:hypothetical protein
MCLSPRKNSSGVNYLLIEDFFFAGSTIKQHPCTNKIDHQNITAILLKDGLGLWCGFKHLYKPNFK